MANEITEMSGPEAIDDFGRDVQSTCADLATHTAFLVNMTIALWRQVETLKLELAAERARHAGAVN